MATPATGLGSMAGCCIMADIPCMETVRTRRILAIMPRTTVAALPSVQRRLVQLGENIRLARLRRALSAQQVADRAGITRTTLRSIERGVASVALGSYANVLFCLGLEQDLDPVARDDVMGRKIQDAQLTVGRRAPRRTARPSSSGSPSEGSSQGGDG